MEMRAISMVLGLALVPVWFNETRAQDAPTVVIRVHDMSGVPTEAMNRAHERLEAIFQRAGVLVSWRDCRMSAPHLAACDVAPTANEAVVRLLTGSPTLSQHGCGVALLPSAKTAHYISLYVGCIREAADAFTVGEHVVLAGALAHEIGHLMLGPAHGPLGLMQARPRQIDWTRAVRDGLAFTPAESRKLRHALEERSRAVGATVRTRH